MDRGGRGCAWSSPVTVGIPAPAFCGRSREPRPMTGARVRPVHHAFPLGACCLGTSKSPCSCINNYSRYTAPHGVHWPAPHHDDHRGRAARTRATTAICWASGSSRRRSTSTSRRPTTSTSGTRPARPARSSRGSSSPGRRVAAPARARSTRCSSRSPTRPRSTSGSSVSTQTTREPGVLRFADYDGLKLELVVSDLGNAPLRASHPEIPAEHAIAGLHGVRAYAVFAGVEDALLTDLLGFTLRGRRRVPADRLRPPVPLRLRRPARLARPAGRRQRAPHRVGLARRGPPGLAGAGRRRRRLRDRRARPRLLPVDLLPHPERGPVRDRDALARASPSTRTPSTWARRCGCPSSTSTCATSSRPRCVRSRIRGSWHEPDLRGTSRGRHARGPARPPPRPRRRRARPARARRRPGPGAAAARRHPRRAAADPGLAGQALVRRAARRLPRPRDVPGRLRRSSPASTTRPGSAPARRPRTRSSAASRWARS